MYTNFRDHFLIFYDVGMKIFYGEHNPNFIITGNNLNSFLPSSETGEYGLICTPFQWETCNGNFLEKKKFKWDEKTVKPSLFFKDYLKTFVWIRDSPLRYSQCMHHFWVLLKALQEKYIPASRRIIIALNQRGISLFYIDRRPQPFEERMRLFEKLYNKFTVIFQK